MSAKQAQAFDADDFEGYEGNPPSSSWDYAGTVTNPDINMLPEWDEWFGENWNYGEMVEAVRDSRDASRVRGDDEPPAIVTSLDCQNAVSMGQRSPQLEILRQAASKLCGSWMGGTYSPHASARDESKNIIVVAFELKLVNHREGEEYKGRRSASLTPEQLAEVERRWENGEIFHIHFFIASQNTKIKLSSLKSFLPHAHINKRYKHPELGYKYTKKVPADSDFVTSGFDEPYDTMKNGETIHHPLTHVLHYEQGTFPQRLKDGDDKLTATQEAINLWKEQGLKRHEIILQDPARFGSQQVLRTLDNATEADAYARRIGQFDPEHDYCERLASWYYGESTSGKSSAAYRHLLARHSADDIVQFDVWDQPNAYAEMLGGHSCIVCEDVRPDAPATPSLCQDIKRFVTRPGDGPVGIPNRQFGARYYGRLCTAHGEDAFTFISLHSPVEFFRRIPSNREACRAFASIDGSEPKLDGDALLEFDMLASDSIKQYVQRMNRIVFTFIKDWAKFDANQKDPEAHGMVEVSGWEGARAFYKNPLILEERAREEGWVTEKEWREGSAKYRSSMLVPAMPSSSAPETASETPDPEPSAPEGDSGIPSAPEAVSDAPGDDSEPPAVSPLPLHPTADDLERCADELLAVYDWCGKHGSPESACCDGFYVYSGCSLFGQLLKAGKRYARVPGALRDGGIGGVKVGEDSYGRPIMSQPEPPYFVLHLADPYKYGGTSELDGRKVWCIEVQDIRRTAYHMSRTAAEMRKED